MQRTCRLIAAIALASLATLAQAQAWPSKPIKWVVPFAPGGTTDILARTVGEKLALALGPAGHHREQARGRRRRRGRIHGQGGAGWLHDHGRHDQHARDQRVALQGSSLRSGKGFRGDHADRAVPNMLVVNTAVPAKDVKELIALLKANPNKYSFASSGNGTSQHLSGELFKSMSGTEMQHIPYKGSPPALQDVMGGQVTMTFDNITTAWTLAKAGKLRALAVTTAKRSSIAPDVPTLAESGLPGFEVGSWQGVFAPPARPRDRQAAQRRNREGAQLPDVREKLGALGAEIVADSPRSSRRWSSPKS
jgi:tripartite-type tricarboxylate transporter receptor subunit TctC